MPQLLRTSSPTSASAAVERISHQHAAAVTTLDAARAAYAAALSAAVGDGHADLPTVSKARAKLTAAENEERAIRDALTVAQQRADAEQAARRRADLGAQYDQARKLAERRLAGAKAITERAAALAAAWRDFCRLSHEAHDALPVVPDMDAGVFRDQQVTGLFQRELLRIGLPVGQLTRPPHEIPPFDTAFADLADLVTRWRDAALGNVDG
jgi:hypothetical protein